MISVMNHQLRYAIPSPRPPNDTLIDASHTTWFPDLQDF